MSKGGNFSLQKGNDPIHLLGKGEYLFDGNGKHVTAGNMPANVSLNLRMTF